MNSEILIYQNPNGNIKIDVRLENEPVWLTQAQMANLFGKDKRTISEHIGNIFMDKQVVARNFRTTTQQRKTVIIYSLKKTIKKCQKPTA